MHSGVDPNLLKDFEPLNAMRPETVARLARRARLQECTAGTLLFQSGEPATDAVFLQRGSIELIGEGGRQVRLLRAGERMAQHRLVHQSPRRFTARCASRAILLLLDAALLDVTLTWEQHALAETTEDSSPEQVPMLDGVATGDWMMALLNTPLFQRLPPSSLQGLFLKLQPLDVARGDVIIRQGDDAEYFYVLTAGRCRVTRRGPTGGVLTLAELGPGASFGEDALLSGEPRNASVAMLTDGRLMRLARADFRELLREPLLKRIGTREARRLMSAGACRWLDNRLASEFERDHIPGALNLPLHLLRRRLPGLDPALRYICYCDSGRRSAVAAFLMRNAGYEAYLLDRGLGSQPSGCATF